MHAIHGVTLALAYTPHKSRRDEPRGRSHRVAGLGAVTGLPSLFGGVLFRAFELAAYLSGSTWLCQPKRDPGRQSKSYPARGDGSAGRLGRPGKFVMHGVQGHGSAVNGRGPELRKPPALIHLSDLRFLAKNAQNGIVFRSV